MITVSKTQLSYCNLCHREKDDVLTITFKYKSEAGGTSIMLCEKCRKKLIKVLEEVNND